MIFEYALDPEIVSKWGQSNEYRFFYDKFGIGSGRIISRLPNRWAKLVWDASSSLQPVERKRLEEILSKITYRMIVRVSPYNNGNTWIKNTFEKNIEFPYKGILTEESNNIHPNILNLTDEEFIKNSAWNIRRVCTPKRKAEEISKAIKSVLELSTTAIFIDPYFRANNSKNHIEIFKLFMEYLFCPYFKTPFRIEIHAADYETAPTFYYFKQECIRNLPPLIPKGHKVKIIRWHHIGGGEKLHNRYILTNLGGIQFGIGLDAGDKGQTEDIFLMDVEQYELRWEQYASGNPAFTHNGEYFELEGKKR